MQGKKKGQKENQLPFHCVSLRNLGFTGSNFFSPPAAQAYEKIIFTCNKMSYLKVKYHAKQICLACVDSVKH